MNEFTKAPCQVAKLAASYPSSDSTTCTALAGGSYSDIQDYAIAPQTVTYSNGQTSATQLSGIKLSYLNGDACPTNTALKMSFNINIFCDELTDLDYNPVADINDSCAPFVQLVTKYGCPLFTKDQIWAYIDKFTAYFGVFFIGGGIVLCFFGYKLIGPTVCMVGLLTCVVASCLAFYLIFFKSPADLKTFWFFLAGGIIVGIGVGILLFKYPKIGASFAAGWGGIVLGIFLNTLLLAQLQQTWSIYVAAALGAAVCVFLAFKFFDPVIIVSTAVLGAYAITRGVSFYVGHYENEFTIVNLIKAGLFNTIDPLYWIYPAAFILLSLAGGFF